MIKKSNVKIFFLLLTSLASFLILTFFIRNTIELIINLFSVQDYEEFSIIHLLVGEEIDVLSILTSMLSVLIVLVILITTNVQKLNNKNYKKIAPLNIGIIDNLSSKFGISISPKLYTSEDTKVIAETHGFNLQNSKIIIRRELLRELTPPELECLIAHEMAHIKNHDFKINIMLICYTTLLYLLISVSFVLGIFTLLFTSAISLVLIVFTIGCSVGTIYMFSKNILLSLVFGLFISFELFDEFLSPFLELLPIASYILAYLIFVLFTLFITVFFLKFSFLRDREYQADLDAIQQTGNPSDYLNMLRKIYSIFLKDNSRVTPNNIIYSPMRFMSSIKDYRINITKRKNNRIYFTFNIIRNRIATLLNTHPSIEARIKRIKKQYNT